MRIPRLVFPPVRGLMAEWFASQSAPHPPGSGLPPPRLFLLRAVVGLVLSALLVQGLRLQVASGSLFRSEAEENRVQERVEYAPRGIFLDRSGTPLVRNVPAIDLVADPTALPDDRELLFRVLADALPTRDLSAVRERLAAVERPGAPLPVLTGLTHREFLAVASRLDRLPGLRLETTAIRAYRENGPYGHVLGYTGKLAPEERDQFPSYLLTESLGKTGLERQYEALLRGRHGARRVEVDAYGSVQHDLGRVPSVPGRNLRLHLDAPLQEQVHESLARALSHTGGRRGAAVALEPYSGAVRALVSFPTVPHNDLARGIGAVKAQTAFQDPASPFLNRVIQGQYVPGSTFKLAVAAGALEEGIATPTTTVQSRGGLRVGRWFFPDWKPGGHGRTDLTKALAESVNTFFYTIGGGYEDTPGLGIDRLTSWAQKVGFGAPTGIDLPGEASGFLPSPSWKEQTKGAVWYIGDTYHAAIGQGDVLITPLQLAFATAVIANGGTMVTPRLLAAIEDVNGQVVERVPPVLRAEGVLRPETAAAIRAGLRAAVTEGSARGLSLLPVPVAAKTGTAQIGGTDKTHAWVTVVAPAERPELVLVVLLEEGGGGERVAVPVAREILQWYFRSARQQAEGRRQ